MSRKSKIFLAAAAVLATSSLAAATHSLPLPFYVGIFYVGPFAFIWFLIPAALVPILVTKVPLNRSTALRVVLVCALAFGAVAAYLALATSCCGNTGREFGWFVWWVALVVLAVVGAWGYLRERQAATFVFHIILVAWFIACGFPYLGEFL